MVELTYELDEISINDNMLFNETKVKNFLNLKRAFNFKTKNYFTDDHFKGSKMNAPKKILKTYMFNLAIVGSKSSREFGSIFTSLSLIGGFITTMFYTTFYSY